jgi:type II secretory pathway pseudopilin PulG
MNRHDLLVGAHDETAARGYTIAEFMVAMVLLGMIIAMAISVFMTQGRYSRDAAKKLSVDESIVIALMVMKQDIMHGGLGAADRPDLSVLLKTKNSDGNSYKELYVNYGRNLNTEPTDPTEAGNAYTSKVYFQGSGGSTTWTSSLSSSEVGGLISDAGEALLLKGPPPTGPPYTYTLTSGQSGSEVYAPAVSYALINDVLYRNRLPRDDGKIDGTVLMGNDPMYRIIQFGVRAMFYHDSKVVWSPVNGDSTKDFDKFDRSELRNLEITLTYQVKQDNVWSSTRTERMKVAPRTLVLNQY